jgi:hypothetical protein
MTNASATEGSNTALVGIAMGTTLPLSALSVNGGVAIGTTYAGSNAAGANNLIVQGDIGIGTTTPTQLFTVKSTGAMAWDNGSGTADTELTRQGTANIHLGLADAAAPVAQTLGVQNVVAGTANTAGANFTIDGSQGTGTGAGGQIIMQTALASGSSGTTQNALEPTLTLGAGNVYMPNAPSGALASYYACYDPSSTPVGEITYQASNCTTSLRSTKHDIKPYTSGLKDALALQPSTFVHNSGTEGHEEIGLIAEDVVRVNDDLGVYQGTDDLSHKPKLRSVQYDKLGVVAIAAIQEQQKEIDALQGKKLLVVGHKCFFNLLVCAD